jgi:hypothetical protein
LRALLKTLKAVPNRRHTTSLFLFIGVVPEHEVQKILHRRVLEQFLMRQKHLILQFSYKSLRNNVSTLFCCCCVV